MIKAKLIESIRGYLLAKEPDQDSHGKINYQRVAVAVEQAYNSLINVAYRDKKGFEGDFVTEYKNNQVKSSGGVKYLDIATAFIALPEGKGVWYVKPSGNLTPIPQSSTHHTGILSSLPIGDVVGNSVWRVGYVPNQTGKKIILEHLGESLYKTVTRYDYGIVRAFSSYEDSDDVFIPSERYDQLITLVLQWFGKRQTDNSNNNA